MGKDDDHIEQGAEDPSRTVESIKPIYELGTRIGRYKNAAHQLSAGRTAGLHLLLIADSFLGTAQNQRLVRNAG